MAAISRSVKTVTSLFRTRPKQVGLPPGSLVHVGRQEMERPVISRVDYDPTDYRYRQEISVADSAAEAQPGGVCWVQLDGLHDISLVETLGRLVDLHPLALEDILNTSHQPKLEEFPQSLLIILKLLEYDQDQQHIKAEQCSLVVSAGRLLSFREQSGDLFSPIYRRLENASGRFRERGSDYLAYTLIDSAVDSYFHVLETIGDQLEAIEEELITRPSEELLQQIHQLRGQLVFVRKAAAPLRDLVGGLLLSDSPLIDDRTRIYLRDLHEHVVHVMDNIDNYRDTAKGLIDLSLSNMSHRTNEVMQFLTIIASVFIPLTFIAGVYGMNFAHMPELQWRYGYLLAIVLMLCCALAMLWFFKRKKWF